MGRASIEDPIKVFRYRVECDDMVRGGFSEVTGLTKETEVAEYREGGFNETKQKSAGLTNYGNVTLKRGQIIGSSRGGDDDFLNWSKEVHNVNVKGNGVNYRRDFDIVQYDAQNEEVKRWHIFNAWPAKLVPMSDLNATSSDNSFETLELAIEGFSDE